MGDRLIVIGLNGVARSGKDTTAKILESPRFDFFRVAQGDGIRAILFNLMMPSWEILKEIEGAGRTHIDALQQLGGECKDDIGRPEAWTDVALMAIRYMSHYHDNPRNRIVIPGMRYGCESDRFREVIEGRWGGVYRTWKLTREGEGLAGHRGRHQSEAASRAVACDLTIRNDGTKSDLEAAVIRHMADLLGNK